jgi:hypothetical protein
MREDEVRFLADNFKELNKTLVAVSEKMGSVNSDINFIKSNIKENAEDLKEHMRRTEINERRLEQLEQLVSDILRPKGFFVWLKNNYKFLIGICSLITIFVSFLKFLLELIHF